MFWLLATLALVFTLDRGIKTLVFGRGLAAGVGCLSLRPVRNESLRHWSRGGPAAWVAGLTLGFAAACLLVGAHPGPSAALACGLGASLGGALGNVYDRLRHGAVLDFLHVGIGGVFNTADVALVAGLCVALSSHVALATSLLSPG